MRIACLLLALTVSAHAQSGSSALTAPECPDYASKLDSCAPYTCTFAHPITGTRLERKIIGLAGGNCLTSEAMPGKRSMQCAFPPDTRKAVAKFFRDTQAADAAGKKIGGTLTTGAGGKLDATTTVDGKPVVNPLQQAMEAGMCKIGG
jgi:hypothetical protein